MNDNRNDVAIDRVVPEDACPHCGERECDALVWIDEEARVECQRCHAVY